MGLLEGSMNMKISFNRSKLFVITLAASLAINASAQGAYDLLTLGHRPTVSEFLEAHDGVLPAQNPYTLNDYNQVGASLLNSYKGQLANIIAQFEKAFPGATYVGLGRDSALLVDALDAFYLNLGQKKRAVHFNASGSTFQRVSSETIVNYTKQLGLDFSRINEIPPFVFFDGTRFSISSQSRQLMRAIYLDAAAHSISPKDLIYKVNFISTSYNGYSYYPQNWIMQTDVKQFLKNQSERATNDGPDQILSTDAWYLTHGYNWTDTFVDLALDAAGTYQPVPSRMMGQTEQQYVLGHMYYVMELVRTPEFFESVKQEAQRLGYDFEEVLKLRANGEVPNPTPIPQGKVKTLAEKIADLKVEKQQTKREYHKRNGLKLSENAHQLWELISQPVNDGLKSADLTAILQKLIEWEKGDFIGERDFSRILFAILPSTRFSDTDFNLLKSHQASSDHLYEKIEDKIEDLKEGLDSLDHDHKEVAIANRDLLLALYPIKSCTGALQ